MDEVGKKLTEGCSVGGMSRAISARLSTSADTTRLSAMRPSSVKKSTIDAIMVA
jgi:hypothetical protein